MIFTGPEAGDNLKSVKAGNEPCGVNNKELEV